MIKVSVLYPMQPYTKFDMDYYLNRHIPMLRQLLASSLKGVSVEQAVSGLTPGSPAPFVAMCHLVFDSVADFQSSFLPHMKTIIEDVPNYTTSVPIIQINEI